MQKWITSYIKDEDAKKISLAVAEVEKRTSSEIVPMVVRRSSVLGQIPLVVFACLLFVDFALFFAFHTFLPRSTVSMIFLGLIVASIPLSFLLSKIQIIQRLLTPKVDRHMQVMNRAQLEFYQNYASKTEHKTAVLIFISLFEHECVVLADKTIADKLPTNTWDEVVKLVIDGIKNETMSNGLINGIQKAGEHLIKHFPVSANDKNELANELIIKD